MAAGATRRRSPASTKKPAAAKRSKPKKAAASKALAVSAKRPAGRRLLGKAVRKGAEALGGRALSSGGELMRAAVTRSTDLSRTALEAGLAKRPPIQVGVDVAVPLQVAWEEWMSFSAFTEGVHHVDEIERDGDMLLGRTGGPRPVDWAAEIVDERDQQSFAWRSTEGSDCAGLVTFHRLSERLTRIELDLDVLPTRPAEAVSLAVRLADRRAETALRRFKAEVEFINPDVYEDQLSKNGDRPKQTRERQRDA
jgi:uncharacterized membrane protein